MSWLTKYHLFLLIPLPNYIHGRNFMEVVRVIKGLTVLTLEMDCNQTVMGLPLATSTVFLTAKTF
jgi:hypothetical protein